MHRVIPILLLSLALTGCGSLKGQFQNRLVTTMSGDKAFTLSLYGPFGLSSELSAEDAAELQRMRERGKP